MLKYAAISLIVALAALVVISLSGIIMGGIVWLAKGIFVVSAVAFVVFFVIALMKRKKAKS